jgi:hypothetical protein
MFPSVINELSLCRNYGWFTDHSYAGVCRSQKHITRLNPEYEGQREKVISLRLASIIKFYMAGAVAILRLITNGAS